INTARQAAQMNQYAGFARLAQQKKIDEGRQRHALSAGSYVPRAKVADGGHPSALGDHRGHPETKSGRKASLRLMPDGLPRAADALYFLQAEAGPIRDLPGRGCEGHAKQAGQQAQLSRVARPRTVDAADSVPGCHCTPMQNQFPPLASIPSTTPSGARAETRKPSSNWRTAW